ncbi:phage late control D family protein [Helicobacter winghamensis]|uniref:Phage tail protein n=2 Tax=Helicobacter winghamensis TaxID=157268 RepID=A0A2N3PK16_9HELI|nr:phage tail protein [Helicobacter winghamensis]EEO26018.1 phage late control gene D protein (GPD) [Helicobacter winghamensis ATCC BAA-430]PKT77952.1 phage tail protein [Helicobacter winghamensis]PKT81750.1 phage tail protein [Helicobacter winghamensis]PKT81762.1 phage tail protein [Helicobacter winghamensis]
MVNKPSFKLLAKGKDITQRIQKNLISLSFEDKAKDESDEISLTLNGLYARAPFGDSLELWLGYEERLNKCGTFALNSFSKNYTSNITEIRATAINFASNVKVKKDRAFENTNLAEIAKKIAQENNLRHKVEVCAKTFIKYELQNNISDMEFIYSLCAKYGYLACIKEQTLIIIEQKSAALDGEKGAATKGESNLTHTLTLGDLFDLQINIKNRNNYTGVRVSYQDIQSGTIKSVLCGKEHLVYELKIAPAKSESEALAQGMAKLNQLNIGVYEGSFSTKGANIRAGANLIIKGISEKATFSIKDVRHELNSSGYRISVNFEG